MCGCLQFEGSRACRRQVQRARNIPTLNRPYSMIKMSPIAAYLAAADQEVGGDTRIVERLKESHVLRFSKILQAIK